MLVALVSVTFSTDLHAQHGRGIERRTGLELYTSAPGIVYYDREHRVRGVAYEVLGLATLRELEGATIRGRCGGEWSEVLAEARGSFEIDIRIPEDTDFGLDDEPHFDFEISQGSDRRSFEVPVTLFTPLVLDARTDRREYEPGETVHFWARISDARTGRPLAGVPVRLSAVDESALHEMVTSDAGVATVDIPLPDRAELATTYWMVGAGTEPGNATTEVTFVVGERPTTDLFVELETSPETASPGEEVTVRVLVRSPSGFPIRNAHIDLRASSQNLTMSTNVDGVAAIEIHTPEYTSSDRGRVAINGTAYHPGYGGADFSGSFRVRPPSSLDIDVIVPRGGLVPEVRDRLFVSVFGEGGNRPAAGTRVEVRGAAIVGGRANAVVDRHGLLSVPARAELTSFARHVGRSDCAGHATTVEVIVRTEPEQRARLCVRVLENVLVLGEVLHPAVAPGESIEVSLERRPQVSRRPVVAELLYRRNGYLELIDSVVTGPTTRRIRFDAPEDRIGVFYVRVRPLLDSFEGPSLEGLGVLEPLIIRPLTPSFPRLELDREVYAIRGNAQLTVHAPSGAPESYVALMVRDLAQHQGEVPFDDFFLARAFERAVLSPETAEADLLVRAALAAQDSEDTSPDDRSERDPVLLAREYRREVAGQLMVAVERLLEQALETSAIAEVTEGEGPRRRFRPNVVERAVDDDPPETLGGGAVTVDMLTAIDHSFNFQNVARRIARKRLVRLLGVLPRQVDPDGNGRRRPRSISSAPPERWLSELVRRGIIEPSDLRDPWGGTFVLRRTSRQPVFTISVEAEGYELLSPGPDGRIGTPDDIRDPLERAVPEGTLYAEVSGEDHLMAELAALSPRGAALQDLLDAYDRLSDEAIEELVGEGTIGHGSGGGGGSGYGYGAGGLRGRSARVPSIRCGSAAVRGNPLAGIVRQEFPATLFFVAEASLDPSGRTRFEIPLAEAPTTYLVEAILWREDGWVWSSATRMRVDMELIVDAPVPSAATVGDDILLPLRVANRTKTARMVRLTVEGDDALGLEPVETDFIEVPAEDAVEYPVEIPLRRPAEGRLTIAAYGKAGGVIDAVRRPLKVRPSKRRAQDEAETIVRGGGVLEITLPEGARPRGVNRVHVSRGPAIFRRGEHPCWRRWIEGLVGTGGMTSPEITRWERDQLVDGGRPIVLAQLVGANWLASSISDQTLENVIEVMTDHVDGIETAHASDVDHLSRMLLLLAPAYLHSSERPALRADLRRLIRDLRIQVENGAALFADAPWLSARASAALAWTARPGHPGARGEELLERSREALVEVGDDIWLEGGSDDSGDELFAATALLALAEVHNDRDDVAFRLVRSLARLIRSGGGNLPEVRGLPAEDRTMAAAAAAALSTGVSTSLRLRIDGVEHELDLRDDLGSQELEALGNGGEHRIELLDRSESLALLRVVSEYSVDWDEPAPHVGPFVVSIEGSSGTLDQRADLVLVVRNRAPRLIRSPWVVVSLPAGAEVDHQARWVVEQLTGVSPGVQADSMNVSLRPIGPRSETRIPLRWVWTTAGRLNGLGMTAWAGDRPQAVSITPPRQIEVVGGSR